MRVNRTAYESLRPDRAPASPAGASSRSGDAPPSPGSGAAPAVPARSDTVQFSDIGRQMSAAQADAISPERILELRAKVMQGAYNSLEVVDQVARRILDRGDV